MALFLKNFHRAGPVLQEFGLVLRPGVWHSASLVPSPALGLRVVALWSGRPPNSAEAQKELKWPKNSSKVTQADRPQSDPKVTQKWLRTYFWVIFESLLSHLGSLGGGTPKVTFESLLGHFNSFCFSVELGGRPLHNGCVSCERCLGPSGRFCKPSFGHSTVSTELDRPDCKRFRRRATKTFALIAAQSHNWLVAVSPRLLAADCHWARFKPLFIGCGFFAYSWKLPAYSEACLLTVNNFRLCKPCRGAAVKFSPETARGSHHEKCRKNFWWNLAVPLSSGNEARKCPEFFMANSTPFFIRRFAAANAQFHGVFHSADVCPWQF